MTKKYRTALVISGDSKGGIRAVRATDSELKKLEKQSNRNTRSLSRMARAENQSRLQARRLATATLAAGAGIAVVTAKTLSSQDQVGKLAQQLGVSTEALSELQFAAEQTGAGADKLSAGLAVMAKRIGELFYKGTGAAKAALDKLGLSAEELVKLRPDEAFARIADAMQGLSSQSERNAAAANIFSRANQKLVNTLALGSDGMAEMRQEARALGRSISGEQAAAAAEAEDAINRLKSVMQGTSNVMATSLAPAVTALANGFTDELSVGVNENRQDVVNWGDVVGDVLAFTADAGTGALSSLKYGFSSFGSAIGATAAEASAAIHFNFSQVAAIQKEYEADQRKLDKQYLGTDLHKFRDELEKARAKNASLNVNDSRQGYKPPKPEGTTALLNQYDKITAKLKKLKADRAALVTAKATADPDNIKRYETAIDVIDKKIAGLHKTTTRTLSDSAKAANSLDKQYASISNTLSQQIATFGQDGQAAKTRYALEQGALSKLSPARKQHLASMANELDQLQRQKDAVDQLFPAWQQLERAKQLQSSVSDLPPGMQAFGQRRATQMIGEAATQGLPQMQGLDPQYNGAFGEANRLGDDKANYEAAYQKRLAAFREYAATHKEDVETSNQAIAALNKDHQKQTLAYDHQIAKARLAGTSDLFGSLAEATRGFAGENSALYRDMFIASKAFAVANAALGVKNAIVSALALPFPANLAAGALAAVEAISLVGDVTSITMGGAVGQAHDGIDNVPREGTWLLDRGERVVDRRTNGDLKRYLAQSTNNTTHNNPRSGDVNIPVNINVEAKPGVSDEEARRQGREIGQAFKQHVESILIDNMRPGGMLANVKRTA